MGVGTGHDQVVPVLEAAPNAKGVEGDQSGRVYLSGWVPGLVLTNLGLIPRNKNRKSALAISPMNAGFFNRFGEDSLGFLALYKYQILVLNLRWNTQTLLNIEEKKEGF